jgi:multimeric flavodoxin WrbA
MQETASKTKDKFEIHLDEMIAKLQDCQVQKNLKSCSACEHYLACELRDDYIKSVYNSMSKGETGGFEF